MERFMLAGQRWAIIGIAVPRKSLGSTANQKRMLERVRALSHRAGLMWRAACRFGPVGGRRRATLLRHSVA
jgi:hypothetical protein